MTSHVHHIIDTIGSEAIQGALRVSEFSIRAAKRERKFPGFWYRPVAALCADAGIDCPLDAFRWKGEGPDDEAV